jgi:hypothetical protein
MNYAEGHAFNMSRIEEGSSMADNLWNSKGQIKLDAERKRGAYMRKHNRVPPSDTECRYSLFNGEGAIERRERMAWMYPPQTY